MEAMRPFLIVWTIQHLIVWVNSATPFFSTRKSRAFGPGLTPNKVVLPCRYFYVELVNDSNER